MPGEAQPAAPAPDAAPVADDSGTDRRSLLTDVEDLLVDARVWFDAEVAYQKTRAGFVAASLKQAIGLLVVAAVLALVALAMGLGAAWGVVTQLFDFEWLPGWGAVLGVLAAGLALVIAFALAGALPLLRAKPAQALREL